jgi:hypothetical protein
MPFFQRRFANERSYRYESVVHKAAQNETVFRHLADARRQLFYGRRLVLLGRLTERARFLLQGL